MATIEKTDMLNDLLEYLYDSYYGYLKCADDVNDVKLKNLFQTLSQYRIKMIQELKDAMAISALTVKDHGSITSALHRTYIDIRSFLNKGDKEIILKKVKRGENYTTNQYDKIIKTGNVPLKIRNLLQMQLEKIRDNVILIRILSY